MAFEAHYTIENFIGISKGVKTCIARRFAHYRGEGIGKPVTRLKNRYRCDHMFVIMLPLLGAYLVPVFAPNSRRLGLTSSH